MLVPGCQAGKLEGYNLPASVRAVPARQMMKNTPVRWEGGLMKMNRDYSLKSEIVMIIYEINNKTFQNN